MFRCLESISARTFVKASRYKLATFKPLITFLFLFLLFSITTTRQIFQLTTETLALNVTLYCHIWLRTFIGKVFTSSLRTPLRKKKALRWSTWTLRMLLRA